MRCVRLSLLEDGVSTGLSPKNGGFLAEAASVCFAHKAHGVKIPFEVGGDIIETIELHRTDLDPAAPRSFLDLAEAVQFGAMGVAVALIHSYTGWQVIRSWKGTGFDYWVGNIKEDQSFQEKMRLEISGDLAGTKAELQARLKAKLEQTTKSDHYNIPACAFIVEFGTPKSLIGMR